ncbi:MAG TPA: hypothetical protein VFX49_16615, partial [Chloroflexota bacterium]|nr:hypothetical protein [Chloroflexota bacterium]
MISAPSHAALPSSRARESLDLLTQAAHRWEHRRPEDDSTVDASLWLRAGRAAWAAGDGEEAGLWYSRAAEELLDVALGFGTRTGTYAYYAELALGCAALSQRRGTVNRIADLIRFHPAPPPSRRARGRWASAAEPVAVAHEALRAWAARLLGEQRDAAAATLVATRLAGTLPPRAAQRWSGSHWSLLTTALEALLDGRADRLEETLVSLDRLLAAEAAVAPTCTAAVNETLAALAALWRRTFPRSYAASGPGAFALAIEPGTGTLLASSGAQSATPAGAATLPPTGGA